MNEAPAPQELHPFSDDDNLNHNLYDVARKVDKLLNREPVENHAALLGMIQVTAQRRMHKYEQDQKKAAETAKAEAERRQKFAPN